MSGIMQYYRTKILGRWLINRIIIIIRHFTLPYSATLYYRVLLFFFLFFLSEFENNSRVSGRVLYVRVHKKKKRSGLASESNNIYQKQIRKISRFFFLFRKFGIGHGDIRVNARCVVVFDTWCALSEIIHRGRSPKSPN